MKFIGFKKLKETIAIIFYDKNKEQVNSYFVQLSFKDMWKYPHREERFNNGSYIYGWGFLYVGRIINK